jgi:hypothetical protein
MVLDIVENLEKTDDFKKFIEEKPDYSLAHIFWMIDENNNKTKEEIGYYSEKNDDLVVFEMIPSLKQRDPEEAFKKEGIVKTLDIKEVNTSF